jgi:hypothetical protein
MGWLADILSTVCFFLFVIAIAGRLDELSGFVQSLWGGRVRQLRAEVENLRAENARLRREHGAELKARVGLRPSKL